MRRQAGTGKEGEGGGCTSSGMCSEKPSLWEKAIAHPLLVLLGLVVGLSISRQPGCLASESFGFTGKLLRMNCALGFWGRQDCRIQPGAASFAGASLFVLPSSSLEPFPNPLGLLKCATWFLKKASFFSLIIKLPRNNGCHLKQ